MRFVKSLEIGMMLAASACIVHAQAKPVTGAAQPASAKTAQAPAKPASSGAPSQAKAPAATNATAPAAKAGSGAAQSAKPTAKSARKPSGSKQAAKKPASKPSKPVTSASKESSEKENRVARRDPFESLVGHGATGGTPTGPLPPGKAGLQVSTLRLDGIVRAPTGMIAVVSNPQARTYFLREGDQLYDGRVEKIAMDGVSFHEVGKDAFGKPVERQVNKRIYASAGEQQ